MLTFQLDHHSLRPNSWKTKFNYNICFKNRQTLGTKSTVHYIVCEKTAQTGHRTNK